MQSEQTTSRLRRRTERAVAIGALVVMAVGAAGAVAGAHGGGSSRHQRADVLTQGGEDVYQARGARLHRTDHSIEAKWRIRTPEPGTYTYPTPDMVPPGAPLHPPIDPGYPEVFTLWAFVFDVPDACTDGVCDMDDIGDTPARGSVYQLDGEIAYRNRLVMSGKIRIGQAPAVGLGLSNPLGAEVHLAMAPHGTALDGDELVAQLNGPVGGPPQWFPALFFPQ